MLNKLKMQMPNITDKNIEQIARLFPNVMTEIKDEAGKIKKGIDFDLLKQTLSDVLVDDENERYRLDWPGKKASLLKANTPIAKILRPCREESVNFDTTENLYIEGDNFEVLKILQESYLGKIKMIYIDPPYNTGNDFIYSDKFKVSKEEYEEEIGAVDEDGVKLFKNTDSNGRFHSDWLSMMYERLVVARDLLKDNGVIFISIDDNEVHNLRNLCDEIFGAENLEVIFNIKVRHENRILREDIRYQLVIEYVLCYSKSRSIYTPNRISKEKNTEDEYKYNIKITGTPKAIENINGYEVEIYGSESYQIVTNTHELGKFKKYQIRGSLISQRGSASEYYEINLRSRRESDGEGTLYKVLNMGVRGDGLGYRYIMQPESFNFKNGFYFQGKPLNKKENKGNPYPNYYDFVKETNRVGYEGNIEFKNGKKPLDLLKKIFEVSNVVNGKEDTVLDFFSGSATTAHAVMQLNAEDNSKRKFIMVQLPEKTDEKSEAYKAGYKTIAEIGKERIRRAGKQIKEELEKKNKQLKLGETQADSGKLDTGFRVYKTDTTNMKDVYYHPEKLEQKFLPGIESNIKDDRTPDDLLTQVILDLGLELNLPIEQKEILGNTVFIVQTNALVACFDDNINFKIVDEIAGLKPFKVVFKDAGFSDDKDRINVEERFKRLSPDTMITVI